MNHQLPQSPKWISAARLLRSQGRRGELLAELLSDLGSLFEAGRTVRIVAASDPQASSLVDATETTLESHWEPRGRNAGRVVLKLAGCNSISEAERLAGRELQVLAGDLPGLEPDTWFVRDLMGCTLFDGDTPIGEITGVQYAMAPDGGTRLPDAAPLLEVTRPSLQADQPGSEPDAALVPFVKAWLETVDLSHRRVVMHLPPGLFALEAEPSADSSASN